MKETWIRKTSVLALSNSASQLCSLTRQPDLSEPYLGLLCVKNVKNVGAELQLLGNWQTGQQHTKITVGVCFVLARGLV